MYIAKTICEYETTIPFYFSFAFYSSTFLILFFKLKCFFYYW